MKRGNFLTILLVIALLLSGCSKVASPSPTPTKSSPPTPTVPPTPGKRSITLHPLYVTTTLTGEPSGGSKPLVVTVQPKSGTNVKVGFFETEVGGSGPQWRASGWTAVTLASLLLGIDPSRASFTFDIAGMIDGPSAGALMTVGVLAALLGDNVNPNMAMTGTINPDGTIGPVGGIPQKLQGAKKAGIGTVLVPASQRYDIDEKTHQMVDLVEAGQRLGIKVILVPNIFEAYKQLTGKALPRISGTPNTTLPPRAFDKLRADATIWMAEYKDAKQRFQNLSKGARQDWSPDDADWYAKKAEEALQQGLGAVAYERALNAAWNMDMDLEGGTIEDEIQQKGEQAALNDLKASLSATTDLQGVTERLKAEVPRTASDALSIADAYSDLVLGWGSVVEGSSLVEELIQQGNKMNADQINQNIMDAALYYTDAKISLRVARDDLDIGNGFGHASPPSNARVSVMADLLRHAADANMSLFKSTIMEPVAKQHGVNVNAVHNSLMANDDDYSAAFLSRVGIQRLQKDVWQEPQKSYMTLGGSLNAWANSAVLVAKYYSLGATTDRDGNITGFSRERSLVDMLSLSERRAEELTGMNPKEMPVPALYYFENARYYREGEQEDKLVALNYFWQSAAESEMLGYFSGDYGKTIRDEAKNSGRSVRLLELMSPGP